MTDDTTTTEQFPIGSKWKHPNVTGFVTVTGAPHRVGLDTRYPVKYDNDQTEDHTWIKEALEIAVRVPDADPTPEAPAVPVLISNAIYRHDGVLKIALNSERLVDMTGTTDTGVPPNDTTVLYADVNTDDWIERVVRARNSLARDLHTVTQERDFATNHLERLGQALLEEAERRDWCGEYDDFAEEWDLPKRVSEYDVMMTVRVSARDEDEALSMVRDHVNMDSYGNAFVVDGPDYSADMVY